MDALAQDQGADAMRRPIAGSHAHGRFDALVLATDRRGSRSRQATSEIFRCGLFEPEHGLVARVPHLSAKMTFNGSTFPSMHCKWSGSWSCALLA
jgi:hypothetical protein